MRFTRCMGNSCEPESPARVDSPVRAASLSYDLQHTRHRAQKGKCEV